MDEWDGFFQHRKNCNAFVTFPQIGDTKTLLGERGSDEEEDNGGDDDDDEEEEKVEAIIQTRSHFHTGRLIVSALPRLQSLDSLCLLESDFPLHYIESSSNVCCTRECMKDIQLTSVCLVMLK